MVAAQYPVIIVNSDDRLHHTRKDGLQFILLPPDRFDTFIKLHRHPVHGVGQAGQFFRVRQQQLAIQMTGGKTLRPFLDLLDRTGNLFRHNQADQGHQQRYQQAGLKNFPLNLAQGLVNGCQGKRGAHNKSRRPVFRHPHGHIHHIPVQGTAVSDGTAQAGFQGRRDFRPVLVILHSGGIFFRIADHLPFRQNNRYPRSGSLARLLTDPVYFPYA